MVSGLRLLAANSGIVVAAGIWGKLKTAFTMVAIIAILFWLSVCYDFDFTFIDPIKSAVDNVLVPILVWISTVLTVISGGVYLKGYWHLIDSDK
jgi:CDP-diacylglycerol--glycerol-3-phosphate 3-phosphatidyltransferase